MASTALALLSEKVAARAAQDAPLVEVVRLYEAQLQANVQLTRSNAALMHECSSLRSEVASRSGTGSASPDDRAVMNKLLHLQEELVNFHRREADNVKERLALSESNQRLKESAVQAMDERARAVSALEAQAREMDELRETAQRTERQLELTTRELLDLRRLLDAKATEADRATRLVESVAGSIATEKERFAAAFNDQLQQEAKLRKEKEQLTHALNLAAAQVKQLEAELAEAKRAAALGTVTAPPPTPVASKEASKGLTGTASSIFSSISALIAAPSASSATKQPVLQPAVTFGASAATATAGPSHVSGGSLSDSVSNLAAQYVMASLPLPSKLSHTWSAHKTEINALKFSQDGRLLFAASSDGNVSVWDAATGRNKALLLTHSAGNAVLSLDVYGSICIGGCMDRCVRVWDVETQRVVRSITGHNGRVHATFYQPPATGLSSSSELTASVSVLGNSSSSSSRGTLFTGGSDRCIKVWDYREGRCLRSIDTKSIVNAIAVRDTLIAVGTQDSAVRVYDVRTGAKVMENATAHSGPITSLSYNRADGYATLLTGSRDNTLRLLDANTLDPIVSKGDSARPVVMRNPAFAFVTTTSKAAMSPSGQYAVAGGTSGFLYSWQVSSGDFQVEIGNAKVATKVKSSEHRRGSGSGGDLAATAASSSWEAAPAPLNPHEGQGVVSVDWSSEYIASCDTAGNIAIWGN
jgi:WD40 repeat protein